MKIRYKTKRLNFYLMMAIFWLILGLVNLWFSNFKKWSDYILLVVPVLYVAQYSYNYFNQYLIIENNTIKENYFFGKKIKMNEIVQIKKFAGDYILKTKKTALTINTQIIDSDSLLKLTAELEKLEVEFT